MSNIESVEEAGKVVNLSCKGGGGLHTVVQGIRWPRTSVNILIFVAYSSLSKFLLLHSLERGYLQEEPRKKCEMLRKKRVYFRCTSSVRCYLNPETLNQPKHLDFRCI
jgi:hypothetical protein